MENPEATSYGKYHDGPPFSDPEAEREKKKEEKKRKPKAQGFEDGHSDHQGY